MNTDIEHTSLRQEILESSSHTINVSNIVVTLAGASIFAAFQFRNPYIALLPLFVLYYGRNVAFNNSQTIARTSVYLRFVEKERYETLLHELRSVILKKEKETRAKTPRPIRWLTPHSTLWEQWISPTLQTMFIVFGFVCILCFGLIAWLMASNPNSSDLILDPLSNSIIFAISIGIWLIVAIRSRRIAHPFYGEENMADQFETAWNDAIDIADSKHIKSSD